MSKPNCSCWVFVTKRDHLGDSRSVWRTKEPKSKYEEVFETRLIYGFWRDEDNFCPKCGTKAETITTHK